MPRYMNFDGFIHQQLAPFHAVVYWIFEDRYTYFNI